MCYELARCELYLNKRHGPLNTTSNNMYNRIILMESIDDFHEYENYLLWKDSVHYIISNITVTEFRTQWSEECKVTKSNWTKFCNVMSRYIGDPYYNKINIVQRVQVCDNDGFEWTTAIMKTYWLRLIQRRWKSVYRKRMEISKQRAQLTNLRYREIYGKWPCGINYLPSIRDMNVV